MSDVAISAQEVAKDFLLPHERRQSIKSVFTNLFRSTDKAVERQHALRGVSFEVEKGEFFGILGRNGSGKSTLLKMLAGIYAPTSGHVHTEGKLVPFIELGVGFNPELTGRENVHLNGAMLGFSKAQVNAMYDDIVAFAELENFMDQKLKNYSSGMQVRLAFSMATRSEADILLVDEVLAVGDADFQRKCYDYFKSLKKDNKTVVFVTHDMGAVREYCDRAILIDDGVISAQGTAEDVADEYLKLFNAPSENKENVSQDRWGNGWASIEHITTKVKEKVITVEAVIRSNGRKIDEFTFGYRFTNGEGRIVAAGNSMVVEGGAPLTMKENERLNLKFVMPDFLGNDTYTLGATVRLNDKVTVCDNWESVTTLKSVKHGTYYPVWAPATMEVTHGN
jgi:ABC-2 type transport system ATP-binding protein